MKLLIKASFLVETKRYKHEVIYEFQVGMLLLTYILSESSSRRPNIISLSVS